jgi:hypothetical protein
MRLDNPAACEFAMVVGADCSALTAQYVSAMDAEK